MALETDTLKESNLPGLQSHWLYAAGEGEEGAKLPMPNLLLLHISRHTLQGVTCRDPSLQPLQSASKINQNPHPHPPTARGAGELCKALKTLMALLGMGGGLNGLADLSTLGGIFFMYVVLLWDWSNSFIVIATMKPRMMFARWLAHWIPCQMLNPPRPEKDPI